MFCIVKILAQPPSPLRGLVNHISNYSNSNELATLLDGLVSK